MTQALEILVWTAGYIKVDTGLRHPAGDDTSRAKLVGVSPGLRAWRYSIYCTMASENIVKVAHVLENTMMSKKFK